MRFRNVTENRVQVSITPPHRWRESEALELGEGLEEVLGESDAVAVSCALVDGRVDPGPVVVDRVVATPHDPVVGGDAVVVELVGGVRHALTMTPADRVELTRR